SDHRDRHLQPGSSSTSATNVVFGGKLSHSHSLAPHGRHESAKTPGATTSSGHGGGDLGGGGSHFEARGAGRPHHQPGGGGRRRQHRQLVPILPDQAGGGGWPGRAPARAGPRARGTNPRRP